MKTCEPLVLKAVVALMFEHTPWGYFSVEKDGVEITFECEKSITGMKFKINPEKIEMFECWRDTNMVFLTSNMMRYLRKVSSTDTLKVVLYEKITIYPVLKNLRNAVLKVSLIIPGYFFFAKYMENARIKRKIFFTRGLP